MGTGTWEGKQHRKQEVRDPLSLPHCHSSMRKRCSHQSKLMIDAMQSGEVAGRLVRGLGMTIKTPCT